MLIIHPKDETTLFLKELYKDVESRIIDQTASNKEIKTILNHVPKQERIMLLGHGSESGLFSREDDTKDEFDRLIISHQHVYYLRNHGSNTVGIWCHADAFARKEGLHGLFSGMIISEMSEAEEYGISTTPEDLKIENSRFASNLSLLINNCTPLHLIPKLMSESRDIHNELTKFNYNNLFHL